MWKQILGLSLAVLLPVGRSSAQTGPSAKTQTANWIRSLQYADPALSSYGAIKVHHDPGHLTPAPDPVAFFRVGPYNSNLAVTGLLRERMPLALTVAERWITWYLGHLEPNSTPPGVVLDHWYRADGTGEETCIDASEPKKCNYDDASDSYAATFLAMCQAYVDAGGSTSFLTAPGKWEKLQTIAGVILDLQQADGLTWNKNDPSQRVKFLMDNCECYQGLRAAEQLARDVFGDSTKADQYGAAAYNVRQGILSTNGLLNPNGFFRVAKFTNNTLQEADLNQWYPGTVALQWPHLFGVIDPQSFRAQMQIGAMNASWDGDPNPNWTTNVVEPSGFLFPSIGVSALVAGDETRSAQHATFVASQKVPNFNFPWTVDDAGWLLQVLPTRLPEQVLTAGAGGASGDEFGFAVAVDGDRAVVGAFGRDENGKENSGVAYVFERDQNRVWQLVQKLIAADADAYDWFGYAVDISGETIVVGAPFVAVSALVADREGKAYVFRRNTSGVWQQEQDLVSQDLVKNDRFGHTVAVDGDTIVVGVTRMENRNTDEDAAYVFERSGTTWTQTARLTDTSANSTAYFFASAVDISSDTVAVGALRDASSGPVDPPGSGAVFMYQRPATGWSNQTAATAVLRPTGTRTADGFGGSVGIDGNTIVVGALTDFERGTDAGAGYIFQGSAATWSQKAKLTASNAKASDHLGRVVGISGDTVVLTAAGVLTPNPSLEGSAYVFQATRAGWKTSTELFEVTTSDGGGDRRFPHGLGVGGSTILLGATLADHGGNQTGSVYALELPFEETPTGTEVVVQPVDPTTGTTPVTIDFTDVITAGSTSVTTSSSGPVLPSGFTVGELNTYYDIETTATVSGPIELCIHYSGVSIENESMLRLLHFKDGQWVDVTTSRDPENDKICGQVTSFSSFAVTIAAPPAELIQSLIIQVQGLPLAHPDKHSLVVKLEVAQGLVQNPARDNPAAIVQLQYFILGVESLVTRQRISQPVAEPLIAAAKRIIAILGD